MSASANERFGVAPAPEGLVLVQELLNTRAVNDAPDLLQDLATAQPWAADAASRWAERKGQLPPGMALTVRDLSRLRSLRGRLRASLSAGTDGEVNPRPTTAATVQLSLGPAVTAVPVGRGSAWFASAALLECFLAQGSGAWTRLKTCGKESCRVAFFDRTRNNNAVWHDFRYCGNAINLRASRARRKAAADA